MNTMSEIITTAAGATTVVNNAISIVDYIISNRKQNKIIKAAQIKQLEVAVYRVVQIKRANAMHELKAIARRHLIESYNEVKEYLNTPIGDLLLDSLRDEVEHFRCYYNDFDALTGGGFGCAF